MKSSIHPLAFSKVPLLQCAVALAVGISVASEVPDGGFTGAAFALFGLLLAVLLRGRRSAVSALLVASVGLGCGLAELHAEREPDRIGLLMDSGFIEDDAPALLTGRLVDEPEPSPQGFFLRIAAENMVVAGAGRDVSGAVRVFVSTTSDFSMRRYAELDPGAGDLIRTTVRLGRGDRYLNPGVVRVREVLDGQGIDATARVKSALLIEVVERGGSGAFAVRPLRNLLIREIDANFSQPTSGVMIASLLGNRHYLDKRTAELFRDGGTFHVLVISGLHITFIGGLLLLATSAFTADRRVQFLVASGFLWAFSVAVGAEVPVLRAVLMFTVMLAGRAIRRDSSTLNALGCSALILLVWRPLDLFSPSFQLTFLSVWSIATVAMPLIEKMKRIGAWTPTRSEPLPPRTGELLKRLCETVYWREEKWEFELGRSVWSGTIFKRPLLKKCMRYPIRGFIVFVFEGLAYSVIVQTVLLPIQIYYFHRVATGGILLNLWIGFLIALESFLTVAALAAGFVWRPLAGPFVKLAEIANDVLFFVPELVSHLDFASIRVPLARGFTLFAVLFTVPVVSASFAVLKWNPFGFKGVTVAGGRGKWNVLSLALFVISTWVLVANPIGPWHEHGTLRVDFLDVGQGDAALVTFPDGTTMLVDGGGRAAMRGGGSDGEGNEFEPDSKDIGEAVVSEFLWERGISTVDYLVATHADTDHMQGLVPVLDNFSVGRVLIGRNAEGDSDFDELSAELARQGVLHEVIGAGDALDIGGVGVRVLHPQFDGSARQADGNAESIVLMLRYGSRSFLLMGDLEKEGEVSLVRSTGVKADVVKAGHHGSRTSSVPEFVSSAGPEYVVISVGRKSPFGHPHKEVVSRWRESGAKVFITGEEGTVTVKTDGKQMDLKTYGAELKQKNPKGF